RSPFSSDSSNRPNNSKQTRSANVEHRNKSEARNPKPPPSLQGGFEHSVVRISVRAGRELFGFRIFEKMIGTLDPRVPSGPLDRKWRSHKDHARLVNPNNRRKFEIIVVGSGLAGGSAAATLGELGYRVKCFCYQDSPRRAHSIAAQGGINAAKNYQNDGDSVFRLFYDTIKGGDFRSREANVYRLAEV